MTLKKLLIPDSLEYGKSYVGGFVSFVPVCIQNHVQAER